MQALLKALFTLLAILTQASYAQPKNAHTTLNFADWQNLGPADRSDYMTIFLRTLGEVERSRKSRYCIHGGQVYDLKYSSTVDRSCTPKIGKCEEDQVQCAAWISPELLCVAVSNKKSATETCWDQLSEKKRKETFSFLESSEAHELWSQMRRAIQELCSQNQLPICTTLSAKSDQIRAHLPSQEKEIDRLQRKLRDAQGKQGSLDPQHWIRFLLPRAYAENSCYYNKETGTFSDRQGHTVNLIFGTHGIPAQVHKIFDLDGYEPGPSATNYRDLIKAHEQSLPSMRANSELTAKIFNSQKINWVGKEGSQENLLRLGGLTGRIEDFTLREQMMRKMGLSASEIRDVMIILFNPSIYALYQHYKTKGFRPKLVGLDNLRDPEDQEIQRMSRSRGQIERIGSTLNTWIDQLWPPWVREKSKPLIGLAFGHTDEAIALLRNVQSDARATELTERQKIALQQVLSGLSEAREARLEVKKEQDVEFDRRNVGMANDILKELKRTGNGQYHVGALHKQGLLAELKTICEESNPSRSSTEPREQGTESTK